MQSLRQHALRILALADPTEKSLALQALQPGDIGAGQILAETCAIPGRPARPVLVLPKDIKKRSVFTPHGHAALIHALAHIEHNAINLALDIVWRFAGMPEKFYLDWIGVAQEEAQHFGMLRGHLQSLALGHDYGDFPAHDGLWEMAEKTRHDVLARLALVPRTLEARGLDVSPLIRDKLDEAGDHRGAQILDLILRDEIGHVAIGNHWYRLVCAERGCDPVAEYARLARLHDAPRLRKPFNLSARRAAGFAEDELAALESAAVDYESISKIG